MAYSGIRNLLLCPHRKRAIKFVAFHDLLPEELECFEANMRFLKRDTNVVSLDDFFVGRLSSEKINTVITFDDGYKSWVSHAIAVMKKLELPAVFFVSSGFVGLSKDEEDDFVQSKLIKYAPNRRLKGGLSFEDLRRIVEEGFTIGGHTVKHSNLAELLNSAQLREEIAEDKLHLEKVIGRRIEYFAYPFGAYQNPETDISEVLKDSGYRGAVTLVPGCNNTGSNPYLLHREIVEGAMPLQINQ